MTAAVYMRGLMQHEFGVKPSEVEWVQGRADRLGRKLPSDVRLTQAPAGTELGDLLERGEIDFLITANNPLSFRRGAKTVRRLFPNYAEVEKDYYRRTKIYPIMHTVVIRRDIYERDPWVALNLYKALCQAKEHCYQLLAETGSPKASFAWLQPMIEEEQAIIGRDWYPYGIEQNRPSIEALLQYTPRAGPDRAPRQDRGAVRAQHAARHPAERGAAGLAPSRRHWARPNGRRAIASCDGKACARPRPVCVAALRDGNPHGPPTLTSEGHRRVCAWPS